MLDSWVLSMVTVGLLALVVVGVGIILWRKPRMEWPADWSARLQALEAAAQNTLMAVARHDRALDQLPTLLQTQANALLGQHEALRRMIDERLAQALGEARQGRAEMQALSASLDLKLDQRLTGLEASQTQRLQAIDVSLGHRFETLQSGTVLHLQASRKALDDRLLQAQGESAVARRELSDTLVVLRQELTQSVQQLGLETREGRAALVESTARMETHIQQRFEALQATTQLTLEALKSGLAGQLGVMSAGLSAALREQLEAYGQLQQSQMGLLQASVSQQLASLVQGSQASADQLRVALNERLAAIQADNSAKLEEMRRTVDEKLHATLEQRLGESFKLVSERLELVHKGLGEMQTLAGSVGDLKRVMTNVKSRGTWGEMQLGAIIDNVLTQDQYARNVKTNPGSDDLVEFAIRLPGKRDDQPVWLPIDSKYPVEHYQRLLDAVDQADKAGIVSAGNAFEASIRLEARKISAKYIAPPHTTDFALLYLPTEGLFAEAIRRPGMVESLQNECRVVLTGPANLAAMLNSLQMGFKTLAIERRSSEVWGVLAQVKTEFGKFGDIVESTRKSLELAARKFDELGTRTRVINRRLKDVQSLPDAAAVPLSAGSAPLLSDVESHEEE